MIVISYIPCIPTTPPNIVESFRYLGVTVSGDFRLNNHINNVASKAYKSLGMVKRVLHKAPRNVEKLAYMTLYIPVNWFSCEVWDPYLVEHQTQLENVQRCAVRFIAGLRGVENVTEA